MARLRSFLALADPGHPDFLQRWIRIAGWAAISAGFVALVAGVVILRTPFGRYMRAVADVEFLNRSAVAEESLRRLIEEGDGERFAVYTALASALIEQERSDEALDVLDEAVEKFPSDYRAHGSRCRVGLRLDRADHVLGSCQRAVELAPDDMRNLERRAAALAATGDLDASTEDVRRLVARCGADGADDDIRRCTGYDEWLDALETGVNPFVEGGARVR